MVGQLYECTFDDIGNRTATQSRGDSSGANLNAASYTAAVDGRNLYSSRTVPGEVQALGLAKD